MNRTGALRIIVFVTVAAGLFILPIYPCHVDEREGGSFPPFEQNRHYILPLPAFLVIGNGFQWSEHTPTVDWGINWKYDADRLFVPLLLGVVAAFGLWLWLAPAGGGEGTDTKAGRRAGQRAALAWAASLFVLAALFYFTAGYVDGLYSGENSHIKDTPSGGGSWAYSNTNPMVGTSIWLAWAWCVLSVALAIIFLYRAYATVAAEETGELPAGGKAP
jgi:hypothetical protein